VRVATSALAHELTLLRGEIVERMADELGPGVIVELRTRVGRIPDAVPTLDRDPHRVPRPPR
jgi:hypothetical protein